MNHLDAIYLSHPSCALGDQSFSLEQSSQAGRLYSEARTLQESGFRRHSVCSPDRTAYDLARDAVAILSEGLKARDLSPADADVMIYATCLPVNANLGKAERFAATGDVKYLLDYPASHLQSEFLMNKAFVVGIDQQACTSMIGAIRLAQLFLRMEAGCDHALCLTADRFPDGARYEQSYNLISDGAAAVWVSKQAMGYRLLGFHQITNGAMAQATDDETVGFYFSYTQRLIQELLARCSLTIRDIDCFITQNTNIKAWQILAGLLGFEFGKVRMPMLAETGHIISADNIINLASLERSGELRSGDRILMTMAGYGLNWQAMLMEKL